jgi:cytochrome c oxidase subunit 2
MRLTGKRRFVAIALAALLAFVLIETAAAQTGQPAGVTKEARDMHRLYLFILALAVAVAVLVEGALVFAVIRFRRRGDTLPNQVHGSTAVEILWTAIPVVLVATIFISALYVLEKVENKADPKDLTIEVNGFQWQWAFKYDLGDLGHGTSPGSGVVTVQGKPGDEPTLMLPVDEPIEFKLVSHDVIHSFYIRDFLYKLDVIPGRDNRFVVTPTTTGEFQGQCAEFCGLEHAFMRFHVKVVDRAEFDKWIADQSANAKAAKQP